MRFNITTSYGGGPEVMIAQADDYQTARSTARHLSADLGARYWVRSQLRPGDRAESFANGVSEG